MKGGKSEDIIVKDKIKVGSQAPHARRFTSLGRGALKDEWRANEKRVTMNGGDVAKRPNDTMETFRSCSVSQPHSGAGTFRLGYYLPQGQEDDRDIISPRSAGASLNSNKFNSSAEAIPRSEQPSTDGVLGQLLRSRRSQGGDHSSSGGMGSGGGAKSSKDQRHYLVQAQETTGKLLSLRVLMHARIS